MNICTLGKRKTPDDSLGPQQDVGAPADPSRCNCILMSEFDAHAKAVKELERANRQQVLAHAAEIKKVAEELRNLRQAYIADKIRQRKFIEAKQAAVDSLKADLKLAESTRDTWGRIVDRKKAALQAAEVDLARAVEHLSQAHTPAGAK